MLIDLKTTLLRIDTVVYQVSHKNNEYLYLCFIVRIERQCPLLWEKLIPLLILGCKSLIRKKLSIISDKYFSLRQKCSLDLLQISCIASWQNGPNKKTSGYRNKIKVLRALWMRPRRRLNAQNGSSKDFTLARRRAIPSNAN